MSANVCGTLRDIKVRFFGALRGKVPGDEITIALPCGAVVRTLRQEVEKLIQSGKLSLSSQVLCDSVFATDERLLDEESQVEASEVNVLPPVCGG